MKTKGLLTCLIVVIALFMAGCQKSNVEPSVNQKIFAGLPSAVQQQLDLSVGNLNSYLDGKLQVVSINNLGKSLATKSAVSEQSSFIATGNILDPATVKIGEMQEIYSGEMLKSTQTAINDVISKEVKADDYSMEITWKYNNSTFKTKCYYRESGIVWDNIISGLIIVSKPQETSSSKTSDNSKSSYSKWYQEVWTANWLWGTKRGEMGYKITIYVTGTTVTSTDNSDWGYITLGNAQSESEVTVNSGTYGKIRYALGLCTPTGSVNFSYSTFTVSFSGLGSNIIANGTKSLYPN
ncbi:MAG: hypothetical protein HXX16_12375 [Bacteroidales bacterium]|nr:hypothetical protein [Bacteroidales bacterium]